jgi:hypothetical protein
MPKKGRETSLGFLPDKTRFEIVGLEDNFRNLVLVRANDSGCLIKGEHRTKNGDIESWSPLGINYVISCGTQVRVIYD